MVGACLSCGKADSSNICSGCTMVLYCSRECQKADWKSHKPHCVKPRDGEWSDEHPAMRAAPNARPDEIVARLAKPSFELADTATADPTCRLRVYAQRVLQGAVSLEAVKDQVAEALSKGGDPFLGYVVLPSKQKIQEAEAAWAKRKPGMSGLEAYVKAVSGTFYSSPFFIAIANGNLPLLTLLLTHCQVDVVARLNSYHVNTGGYDVQLGNALSVVLLECARKPEDCTTRPAVLELLLKAGADPRLPVVMAEGGARTALPPTNWAFPMAIPTDPSPREAVLASDRACMHLLVQHGADINATSSSGRTLVTSLVSNFWMGHLHTMPAVVAALQAALELGADPNLRAAAPTDAMRPLDSLAATLLRDAASDDKAPYVRQLVELLHKHGADFKPLPHYSKPLCGSGNQAYTYLTSIGVNSLCAFEVLKFAIEVAGVSPEAIAHPTLKTPLFTSCCYSGNVRGIRLLMAHSADPTVSDKAGWHALQLLSACSDSEVWVARGHPIARMPSLQDLTAVTTEVVEYEMRWRAQKGMQPLMEYLMRPGERGEPSPFLVYIHPDSIPRLQGQEARVRAEAAAAAAATAAAAAGSSGAGPGPA